MKKLAAINTARLMRVSKIRLGALRAQGIPAVLLGFAGIVVAAGAVRALSAAAPTLPDTIRELRQLIESNRRSKPLNP